MLIPFSVIFVYYFITHLGEIKWDAIILYILCIALFWITIKIHPEYSIRYENLYNNGRYSAKNVFSIGAAIYTYYIIRLYEGKSEKVYDVFKFISYVIFFFNLGTLIRRTSEYAMDFGYQMEMAAILFMVQYFYEEHKTTKLLLSLVSMALGVLYGARASILGWAVFIALYIIWERKLNVKKIIMVCLATFAAVIYNSRKAMMFLYSWFASRGLTSRTLYLIASGDVLAADTARQERIWPVLIEILKKSSFFKMYGAYGDRYYLNIHYPYAHNIILEILMTFGKCIGSIIIIIFIWEFLRVCLEERGKGGLMVLAFGCFAICRLMISSSFWNEPYFWALLALLVNFRIMERRKKKEEYKE